MRSAHKEAFENDSVERRARSSREKAVELTREVRDFSIALVRSIYFD